MRSVDEMSESAYKYFEINTKGYLQSICDQYKTMDDLNNPRQQFPLTYVPNGYIDLILPDFVRKNNMLHGNFIIPFITPKVTEIDNMDDLKYLEFEIKNKKEILYELFN